MDKRKTNVFLSGAIGCYGANREEYKGWRDKVKNLVSWNDDFMGVCDPTDYYEYTSDADATEIMKFFFHCIKKADILLLNLKDINKSIGACQECACAYFNDVPIIGFASSEDEVLDSYNWVLAQCNKIFIGEDSLEEAVNYISKYYG